MIERMAEAIYNDGYEDFAYAKSPEWLKDEFRGKARRALAAMRDMITASLDESPTPSPVAEIQG